MKVFDYRHSSGWSRGYGGFYLIHAWPADEGNLIGCGNVRDCREYFTLDYQESVFSNRVNACVKTYALATNGTIDAGSYDPAWLAKAKNSILMLNIFEKEYKIPLTRVYPVTTPWKTSIFIIGAKRWSMNRYALGLWTLFFRLALTSAFNPPSIQKLIPTMTWKEIRSRVKESTEAGTLQQARSVFPKVEDFFEFEKMTFTHDQYQNWRKFYLGGITQRPEGIMKLVSGVSDNGQLQRLWREFQSEKTKKK